MSKITPSSNSSMLPRQSINNPLADFGNEPILGAALSGDDPIEGGVINLMGSVMLVGATVAFSTNVIPLMLASSVSLVMLINDYLLQCKRIKNPDWNAVEVKAEPVVEAPAVQLAAPESPTPIVETPTPVTETPPPSQAVQPVVTTSEWDIEEVAEETKAASIPSIPDLAPVLTAEQIKATEFAAKFLGNDRVWSADQLAAKHSMTSEQWCNALSWLAITLSQDYLWTADMRVLIKLR